MEAHCYLCILVTRFAELALEEASKMTGILLSIKCVRTNQVPVLLAVHVHKELGYSVAILSTCSCMRHDATTIGCATDEFFLMFLTIYV